MFNPQVDSGNNTLKDITDKFNTGVDVGVLVYLLHKSRWWIVLFFILSFFMGFLYLRYSQPVYESKAIVQINEGNQAGDILKLNSIDENSNLIAEAIEQVRSRVFLRRVVEKLDIGVNYFAEGTFKNNELYHSSP
jgi:uncharacterized protein involved in exopolysaccharide biosynthesis